MRDYTAVSFEKDLMAKVDQAVEQDPSVLSRAEFCRRAIAEFLEKKVVEK